MGTCKARDQKKVGKPFFFHFFEILMTDLLSLFFNHTLTKSVSFQGLCLLIVSLGKFITCISHNQEYFWLYTVI